MAVLGASFQIGRSALAAYQSAIAVTGQNLANVGNPDYTRQTGHLSALPGGNTLSGVTPGTGVSMDQLLRHIDEAVEARLRQALSERNSAETVYQTLNDLETLFGELSDSDLSTQLGELFSNFSTLQTDPAEITSRELTLASAEAIVSTLQRYRSGVYTAVGELNDLTESLTRDANAMVKEVATLNSQIVAAAARGYGGDGALRDRRDALLRELSQMMDIQTREQRNGVINVYVGSQPLVEFDRSRGLTTERVLDDGVERVQVRFADNNGTVLMREGRLAAVVAARDVHLASQLDQLDQLARGLIYEVNRVHSSGIGLHGYTNIVGAYALDDPDAALNANAAGVSFPVKNGTFLVHVRDKNTGRATTRMIQVDLDGITDPTLAGDADTSLTSLAKALNAVDGLSASVTADNRLQLNTDPTFEVSFSDDSSGALAALGIGVFFEGTDAGSIAVSSMVKSDPRLIATSASGAPGDGTNAGRLATVGAASSELLNDLGVQDFHAVLVNQLAVDTAAAKTTYEALDTVYSSLQAQREAVSGVSLDEEAINLTMYERSFQGASRYLSVLDTLSDSILALVT